MQICREESQYLLCKKETKPFDGSRQLGDDGRALWKKEINYHRRSRVETHMFRDKTILGNRLTIRREWSQTTEVNIRLDILNRMTELGKPKSYRVIA
jgi:hypothetical protein